jgi:hypothetical protein
MEGDNVPQPHSLYYARSENGGRTFSDAKPVVEEPAAWREILEDDKGNLHLLWQRQDAFTTVWDQVSLDGGNSWQFPQGLPDEGNIASVVSDPLGRLHVVSAGLGTLDHWLWDGGRWNAESPLHWLLASDQQDPVELVAAAVNKQGKMVVVLTVPTGAVEPAENLLFYSTRTIELELEQSATQEVLTRTPLAPTSAPATPTSEYSSTSAGTATGEQATEQFQTKPDQNSNRRSAYAVALLPVALLLLSVLGIMIRRANQVKDR